MHAECILLTATMSIHSAAKNSGSSSSTLQLVIVLVIVVSACLWCFVRDSSGGSECSHKNDAVYMMLYGGMAGAKVIITMGRKHVWFPKCTNNNKRDVVNNNSAKICGV